MKDTARDDGGLFDHAPPMGLQRQLGLVKPDQLNVASRALLVVLIEWVALALQVGCAFEDKWLKQGSPTREAALEKPDFSATADLYPVVSNVHALRFIPVEFNSLIALASAPLLLFAPVLLLAVPAELLQLSAKKLLFREGRPDA